MVQENIFAQPLTIEDIEAKFKHSVAETFSFIFEGSCIKTQPSPTASS